MMYKLLNFISIEGRYKSPSLIRKKVNELYFLANNDTLLKYCNNSIEIVKKFNSDISLKFVSDTYLLVGVSQTTHLYDIKKNKIINNDFLPTYSLIENNCGSEYLYFVKMSDEEDSNGVYDINKQQFLFKNKFFLNIRIFNKTLLLGSNKNVLFYLREDGDFFWQHDLSHLGVRTNDSAKRSDTFSKFLGVTNNAVFILLESNCIVVLDILTGALIKVIYLEGLPIMRDAFMHPKNNHIYCLHNKFVKINTESMEVEVMKEITTTKSSPDEEIVLYGIKTSSYQDKYISFTSFTRKRTMFAKWIGLFDYEKAEIIWHYELLPEEGQLSFPAGESPQLCGDKLYILDTDNTLHVMNSIDVCSFDS